MEVRTEERERRKKRKEIHFPSGVAPITDNKANNNKGKRQRQPKREMWLYFIDGCSPLMPPVMSHWQYCIYTRQDSNLNLMTCIPKVSNNLQCTR